MKKNQWTIFIALIISVLCFACGENAPVAETPTIAETMEVAAENKAAQVKAPAAELSRYTTEFDSSQYNFKDGIIDLNWQILARVTFDEQYNEELDQYIPYPIFSPSVRAVEGKEVYIQGYYIPVDESGDADIVVLSAFPFSACFFCGNAGPESVMDIQLKKKTKLNFKTDDRITFKGKLKLNDTDLYYLNYILEDAELVE